MRGITATLAFLAVATPLEAQSVVTRPWADWRTIETPHFRIHYPAELEAWTRPTAGRLESVHEAVTAFVGYAPADRITVLIDDPVSVPYGSAWPGDIIVLWPTPPDPAGGVERYRSWGEIVSIHELAHVAHFSRPSRNPRERFLWGLLPLPMPPILRKAPRWALEGYATLIEGRLTGQGRPHGAWRPAVLRQWALEGRLPTYERLSDTEGFLQSRMAYLVGSAYLEWLVERSGEESLPHLWRRLSARRGRDFDEAFAGVFGGPPGELYGRFKVEVTAKALAAEETLEAAGIVEGELVQRLDGWTGEPAVSPDGRYLAIFRQADENEPGEIVVWATSPDTLTTRERQAEERALAKDPEDVPDAPWRPRPKRTMARLRSVTAYPYLEPRWLPDGERILVVRSESQEQGVIRPDLFEWRWRDGELRRVTRGAAIRQADPDPHGRAVGTRCLRGACDLVRIDLATGAVNVLAAGQPDGMTYAAARALPDGRIVASVRIDDRWRIGLFDASGRFLRTIDPDDGAVRFSPAPLPGGGAVVAVSDRSGVFDLERIELERGATRPLTRTTGAALAPAPDPAGGGIYFLSLTTHGYDLRRIHSDSNDAGTAAALDPDLAPVAPLPSVGAPEFGRAPVASDTPYGLGPRRHLALPLGHWAPEGWSAGAIVHGSDPVGRLGWSVGAMAGEESAWRGAAAAAVWRGFRPEVRVAAFAARQRPSEQSFDGATPPIGLDLELTGGAFALELRRGYVAHSWSLGAGGSAARLERPEMGSASRALGYAELNQRWRHVSGRWRVDGRLTLHGSAGTTDDEGWARAVATARLAVGRGGVALGIESLRGETSAGSAGFEEFALGGVRSPLVPPEVLSQRLEDPAVPVGYAVGTRVEAVRLELVSGGTTSYYRWMRGDGSKWKRVTGFEGAFDVPPLPFLGLPAVRLVVGLGRSLDEPLDDENRFYLALRYDP